MPYSTHQKVYLLFLLFQNKSFKLVLLEVITSYL